MEFTEGGKTLESTFPLILIGQPGVSEINHLSRIDCSYIHPYIIIYIFYFICFSSDIRSFTLFQQDTNGKIIKRNNSEQYFKLPSIHYRQHAHHPRTSYRQPTQTSAVPVRAIRLG